MSKKRPKPTNPCGARTKTGAPCKRPAGWGTNHPGKGPCRNHLPKPDDTPIAFYAFDDLVALARKHRTAAGKDPFDLTDDIASCRATRDMLLTRSDILAAAVMRWAAETKQSPPKSVVDLNGYEIAQRLFATLTKMVETQMRREALDSLTKADVKELFIQIGDTPGQALRTVLSEHLPDLDPEIGDDIVGSFSRTIADAWQALAARA